jgi:hypothetical protein
MSALARSKQISMINAFEEVAKFIVDSCPVDISAHPNANSPATNSRIV